MRQLRWGIAVALFAGLAAIAADFSIANSQTVAIDLPFASPLRLPLYLALLATFCLGALSASAGLLYQLARKTLLARRFAKRVAGLESEIHQLRNLPLAANDPLLSPESPAERARR